MPPVGVRIGGQEMSWEEAYHEASHNPLRPWPYTPDMLALMAGYDDDEPGDDAFSPSRLLLCHRQAVLKSELPYYVDADMTWPLVRGKMVHALMERATYPGVVEITREHRYTTSIQTRYGPQRFTAKPDLIVVRHYDEYGTPHATIVDYKSKSKIEHSLVEAQYEHELQVNMYALIVYRELGLMVDELEIDYVDMSRVRRFTSAGWLKDRGKRLSVRPLTYQQLDLAPIHLWPLDKVERFVQRRIEERIEAQQSLPDCEYAGTDKSYLCNYCPLGDACARRTEEEL